MLKIVLIRLDSGRHDPVGYFLHASLANHHLLVCGDHSELIDDFMRH